MVSRLKLLVTYKPHQTQLTSPFAAAKKLNDMVEGNHIYLTIKYLDRYEVVKYTKEGEIKNGKIAVERDILGKGRKKLPMRKLCCCRLELSTIT